MRVAVIGTRCEDNGLVQLILEHLPPYTTEIVSGGAKGVDTAAREVAAQLGIPFREFLPDYQTYARRAPLVRNDQIIDYADMVLALWDGESPGTRHVIGECLKRGKRVVYIPLKGDQ